MKKVIQAATNMKTSLETYIQDTEGVSDKLDESIEFIMKNIKACNDKIAEIREIIEEIEKRYPDEYWYEQEGMELDNPDEFAWFDQVPDDEVDSYYDAFEDVYDKGKQFEDGIKRAGQIRDMLDQLGYIERESE